MLYKVIISDVNANEGYLNWGKLSRYPTVYNSPSAAKVAALSYIKKNPTHYWRVEKAGPIDAS